MNRFFTMRYRLLALSLTALLFVRCGSEGEDYKENQAGTGDGADTTVAGYPSDKVQEETNLEEGDDPMEVSEITSSLEKQKLLALLMRQKMDMSYRIEELANAPGNSADNTVVQGDIDKLQLYMDKLDQEIVDIRKAPTGSMKEATESALGAIKGAGALLQSTVMRIDRGF